jgi:hypothetical protein
VGKKECVKIIVHPVTTSSQNVSIFNVRSRGTQGRPVSAHGEVAEDIIDRITEMNLEFDTKIVNENGLSVIYLDK